MNTNPASAEQPSHSTGPKWAAEEQHWVPLLSLRFQRWFRLMSLEIPVLVYVSGCAEGSAKNVTSHAVLNL